MWTQLSDFTRTSYCTFRIRNPSQIKSCFGSRLAPCWSLERILCAVGPNPSSGKMSFITWTQWTGFPSALLFFMQFEHSLSAPAQFSGLYIVSLVVILIGFVAFNAVPTPTAATDSSPSSSPAATCEEGCSENPVDAQELQPTEDRRKRSTSGPEQSYGSTELGTRMWSAGLQSANMSYMYF